MKYVIAALTLFGHYLALKYLKLLDNFSIIAPILFVSLISGAVLYSLYRDNKDSFARAIGWGLLVGSSITILFLAGLFFYLINTL